MCTGLEIAALAATAAGSYMQYDSAQSKAEAQREAANAEALRQSNIDAEKNREFQAALGDFDRESQDANLEEAADSRQALMKEVVADARDGDGSYQSPTSGDEPKVIQRHAEQRQGEADDFVAALGDARARLGAWGDARFAPAERLSELGFDLNEYNTQAGRSAQIGQREAQLAAAETGNEMALGGNLLAGLGTAGMGYAGQQAAMNNPAYYQGAGFAGSVGNLGTDYGNSRALGSSFLRNGGAY